jgi:hypothetical protein
MVEIALARSAYARHQAIQLIEQARRIGAARGLGSGGGA